MQWDGVSEATFQSLRGRPCLEFKHQALAACERAGLGVVLVATLVKGVNETELGALLRLALSFGPFVRGLHLQPAAFFGRYPYNLHAAPRLTLPMVMAALIKQAPELVQTSDFHPPACEHELCSFSAVYERVGSSLKPLRQNSSCCCKPLSLQASEGARKSKAFTALHWRGLSAKQKVSNLSQRSVQNKEAFADFLAKNKLKDRFTLSAMAFQDVLSLDVQRVRGCCIHVLRSDGRLLPFCLHNLTDQNLQKLYPDA